MKRKNPSLEELPPVGVAEENRRIMEGQCAFVLDTGDWFVWTVDAMGWPHHWDMVEVSGFRRADITALIAFLDGKLTISIIGDNVKDRETVELIAKTMLLHADVRLDTYFELFAWPKRVWRGPVADFQRETQEEGVQP